MSFSPNTIDRSTTLCHSTKCTSVQHCGSYPIRLYHLIYAISFHNTMNRFQKPVLMDRQPHLFCAKQGNVRRKGRANLALKSLHRPTGQIGIQKLVCIARRYVFKIDVFPYGRHPRIHRPPFSPTDPLFYDTALLPHRSNGSGVSEPLCSRSSDKKDTTPGRMKVCANIPVGGRVYKIIIRIDPKKARKIDRTGRTAMRRSGACRSARSAGATRSTYSSP